MTTKQEEEQIRFEFFVNCIAEECGQLDKHPR